jgi:thioredoxin-related protein
MTKKIQFITTILAFSLFLTACEKDLDDPDPIDPNPIETENCFNAIDISNTIDYARSINFINPTEGWLFGRGVDESSETTLILKMEA